MSDSFSETLVAADSLKVESNRENTNGVTLLTLKKAILKIDSTLGSLERFFLIITFTAIFALILTQIVYRYVLAAPNAWTEALARYSLIYLVMFGSSLALSRHEHLSITIIDFFLRKEKAQRIHEAFVSILVLIACFILLKSSYNYISEEMGMYARCPGSRVPMIYFYASMLIGFSLIMIHAAINFIKTFYPPGHEDGEAPEDEAPGG